MDGGVGQEDGLRLFGLVAAPEVVFAQVMTQIFPQDGAVEGADGPNIQTGGLLQQGLDLDAVLAHDVEVVPGRLGVPALPAAEGPEGAEAVGGEEKLLAGFIAHHDLRPVDHGRHDESEGVAAQGEGVPLLHGDGPVGPAAGEVFGQHGEGLGVAYHLHLREFLQQKPDAARVIRLQVLNHQIVGAAALELGVHILQPPVRRPAVHGVHDGNLFVQDQVGVVGYAVGDGVLALKKVDGGIVRADIADGIRNMEIVHGGFFLSVAFSPTL